MSSQRDDWFCALRAALRRKSDNRAKPPSVPAIELERRLPRSPPELWDELASEVRLGRSLGEVRLGAMEPPHRLAWETQGASGVIELEQLGWGTRVRLHAETKPAPAWERLHARYALEHSLRELLDGLGANPFKSILPPPRSVSPRPS